MSRQLTADDARQSLTDHVATKGAEVRAKFGPVIGWAELLQILEDRDAVRYPCEIAFDAEPLQPGELAHPVAKGETPEEGYTIYVHPVYKLQFREIPYLVLYQLVLVNYGDFASAEDAETFGAAVLGLPKDEYYNTLCELANQVGGGEEQSPTGCQCGC